VTVAQAIEDGARRGATFVGVRVDLRDGRLVIAVEDDGAPRSSRLLHLADRIGALAGTLDVGVTTLHAEIPCE
jgi:hypothetical protein